MLVRRGDVQTAVHLSDADRPRPAQPERAGLPRRGHRTAAPAAHRAGRDRGHRSSTSRGTGCSTSCRSSGTSCGRAPESRWTRSGSPRWVRGAGTIVIDGEEITVDPSAWIGTRDRSWGIRPDRRGRTRWAACGSAVRGHVVAVRADGVRRLLDRAHHPGGAERVPLAERLHAGSGRTAASSSWAGRG